MNGLASGFKADGKQFTSLDTVTASDAVRSFFHGPTICECEGATTMAAYKALHDALGEDLFNEMFKKVEVKLFDPKPISKFFAPYHCNSEDRVAKGDWVYIYNDDKQIFGDLAQKFGKGGAASGWNLVCVSDEGGVKKYLGFGLSVGTVTPMTLPQVKEAMVSAVKDEWVKANPHKDWRTQIGFKPDRINLVTKFQFMPDAVVEELSK